jgi:hypothetical protein
MTEFHERFGQRDEIDQKLGTNGFASFAATVFGVRFSRQ